MEVALWSLLWHRLGELLRPVSVPYFNNDDGRFCLLLWPMGTEGLRQSPRCVELVHSSPLKSIIHNTQIAELQDNIQTWNCRYGVHENPTQWPRTSYCFSIVITRHLPTFDWANLQAIHISRHQPSFVELYHKSIRLVPRSKMVTIPTSISETIYSACHLVSLNQGKAKHQLTNISGCKSRTRNLTSSSPLPVNLWICCSFFSLTLAVCSMDNVISIAQHLR